MRSETHTSLENAWRIVATSWAVIRFKGCKPLIMDPKLSDWIENTPNCSHGLQSWSIWGHVEMGSPMIFQTDVFLCWKARKWVYLVSNETPHFARIRCAFMWTKNIQTSSYGSNIRYKNQTHLWSTNATAFAAGLPLHQESIGRARATWKHARPNCGRFWLRGPGQFCGNWNLKQNGILMNLGVQIQRRIACPGNSEHGDKINDTDVFQYERIVPESSWKYFRGSTHGGNP